MLRKILYIILAMVMLFAFPACNSGDGEDSTQDTTTENLTEEDNTADDIKITVADLANYVVVMPMDASDAISNYVRDLLNSLNEKFSLSLAIKTDLIKENNSMFKESEFEILVGICDREESRSVLGDLKYSDYTYCAIGTKLIVCAISDNALQDAVEHFKTNVIEASDTASESVFFSNNANAYSYKHEYPLDDIKINGSSISEYTLVYPRQNNGEERSAAIMIKNRIQALVGFSLTVIRDTRQGEGKEIHIGNVGGDEDFVESLKLEDNDFYIGANTDGDIVLTSKLPSGVIHAADVFASALEVETQSRVLEINAELGKLKLEETEKLSVMTYNIQMWAPWTEGKPEATMQVIIDKNPDIFGVQESTLPDWTEILKAKFSDTYGCVDFASNGVAIPSALMTENPIFYRKDKFELIESGSKWVTDTPDVESKFEVSAAMRTFTYALLKRKSDGLIFVAVNTHLDHVDGQELQAAALVKYLERFSEYPILMVGDFNSVPASEAYNVIIENGYMNAKHLCADRIKDNIGTAPSHNEIDHCFINGRNMCFLTYEVINAPTFNGTTPSDHYAVYFEFRFCN